MKKLMFLLLAMLLASAALAEDPCLPEAEAVAIAKTRFLDDTDWEEAAIDDSFRITTFLQDWPNGTSTWSVRLHYTPVNELCFYGVELDALTGDIYSAGPERFARMLRVYEKHECFEDYTAYHQQQYEWRWGLPASQWRYEQVAAFTAAHYTLGNFVSHSDAVLPTDADLPYEEAVALAWAAADRILTDANRTDELVTCANTFHSDFVRAFGGMEGERTRRRVWEFHFLDNNNRPLVTVYVASPDGETETIPHITLPEVTE